MDEKFLVVSHNQSARPFRVVGTAFKKESESHYRFFLRLLPGNTYYLTQHWERPWEYVIFSRVDCTSGPQPRFYCKIGSGIYLPQSETIELHLPDLRQVYYIKLKPVDRLSDVRPAA